MVSFLHCFEAWGGSVWHSKVAHLMATGKRERGRERENKEGARD